MTPETQARIQIWRQKALAGTLSQEELREAIQILREDRVGASQVSRTSRAKKAPINADDLLGELEGL